jgi:uncharacterized protein YjiS (DUF1127 family)
VAILAIHETGRGACVVAPTKALVHQWFGQLADAFGADRVGAFYGDEKDPRPITVTTYHSAFRLLERHGSRFDLLVLDEVHHLADAGDAHDASRARDAADADDASAPSAEDASGPETARPWQDALRPRWRLRVLSDSFFVDRVSIRFLAQDSWHGCLDERNEPPEYSDLRVPIVRGRRSASPPRLYCCWRRSFSLRPAPGPTCPPRPSPFRPSSGSRARRGSLRASVNRWCCCHRTGPV